MTINLRPHHLLCLPRFKGKGYSKEFIEKAGVLQEKIMAPGAILNLVLGSDDLCKKCPSMDKCPDGGSHKLARDLDNIVIDATGLPLGSEISAKEALAIVSRVLPTVEMVCTGCEWLDTCKEAEKSTR